MNLFFKQSADQESVEAPSIIFIPGEYFFVEQVLAIDELAEKDLDSFAEIKLEGVSPFPLDQLYWGYVYNKINHSLFLYAMYVGRLSAEEANKILSDEVSYIFPSFLAALEYQYSEPTINFIASGNSLSAVFWNGNEPFPLQIETIPVKESLDQSREELLKTLDVQNFAIEPGFWKLEKAEILPNRSVRFENSYHSGSEESSKPNHTFELNGKEGSTWDADIRSREITRLKYKEQKITRIIWIAGLSVLVVFGLLVVGEVFGLIGKIYLNTKESRFSAQASKVKLIEGQESLAQKIEQISKRNYTPFQMLELLNDSRPKNVYFTSITLGNENNVILDGASASVDDLNKYTDDLHKTQLIEKFEVSQIASRQGRVTFKMDVKFNPPKTPVEEPIVPKTDNDLNEGSDLKDQEVEKKEEPQAPKAAIVEEQSTE